MSKQPNNATDTERMICGKKYVSSPKLHGCIGCAGYAPGEIELCYQLPFCHKSDREDGLSLIFVAETKEQANG